VQNLNLNILLNIITTSWLVSLFIMELLIVVTIIHTSKNKSVLLKMNNGLSLTIFG